MRKILFGLIAVLTVAVTHTAGAQSPREMQIDDQPGLVPPDGEEGLDPIYRRQPVFFRNTEAPGTIIVDTETRFLYLIQSPTAAIRYGIGVGREGFGLAQLDGSLA